MSYAEIALVLSGLALILSIIVLVRIRKLENRLRGQAQPYAQSTYPPGPGFPAGPGQWGSPPQGPYGPR